MKLRCLLICSVLAVCLSCCKKNSVAPAPTIVGKWQLTKEASELYSNGVVIKTFVKSNFTASDFVEYHSDGTGYHSNYTSEGPSLSEFTYTIHGTDITEYFSVENPGVLKTVTGITANTLAIHAVSQVPDPSNPGITDTEIDDINYAK
jgi:hypothetical protein